MKITITLSDAEVLGIKNYLEQVSDIMYPSNQDVKTEIVNIVSGVLHCPKEAVSSYINLAEHKLQNEPTRF